MKNWFGHYLTTKITDQDILMCCRVVNMDFQKLFVYYTFFARQTCFLTSRLICCRFTSNLSALLHPTNDMSADSNYINQFNQKATESIKNSIGVSTVLDDLYLSRHIRKPTICICETKGADQLRSNCEADQRLCFRYTYSTVPLLFKSKISSL